MVLPLVPRNGESELIERDLSGVEGRTAHTGLQLRIFEAAVIAVLVRVCVCYIAALSQLGFNSAAAAAAASTAAVAAPDTRTRAGTCAAASLCTSFTRARRGGGSTHFHPP